MPLNSGKVGSGYFEAQTISNKTDLLLQSSLFVDFTLFFKSRNTGRLISELVLSLISKPNKLDKFSLSFGEAPRLLHVCEVQMVDNAPIYFDLLESEH